MSLIEQRKNLVFFYQLLIDNELQPELRFICFFDDDTDFRYEGRLCLCHKSRTVIRGNRCPAPDQLIFHVPSKWRSGQSNGEFYTPVSKFFRSLLQFLWVHIIPINLLRSVGQSSIINLYGWGMFSQSTITDHQLSILWG